MLYFVLIHSSSLLVPFTSHSPYWLPYVSVALEEQFSCYLKTKPQSTLNSGLLERGSQAGRGKQSITVAASDLSPGWVEA